MPEYQRLFDENSKSRRTIADALEMLREFAGFSERDRAKISIGPLRLPSGDVLGLVDVRFDDPFRKKVWIVSLPTSAQFRAICPGSSRRKPFDIARLDEAAVDAEAAVLLTDETKLRAVEMIPTCSLYDPTELDWLILHCTIAIIGAEERCYRSLRHDAPSSIREMVPDLRFIDCSTLPGLDLPPLKVIASRIAERNWTRRVPSQQTIANALRKFGMRIPKPRPRVD